MHFFKPISLVAVLLASAPMTTAQSSSATQSSSTKISASSAMAQNGAGRFANIFSSSLGQPVPTPKTIFAPADSASLPSRLKARQAAGNSQAHWLYQLSPDFKDASTLRGYTGSIVSTFDNSGALLGGLSQNVLTHGERDAVAAGLTSNLTRRSFPMLQSRDACTPSAPIHLFSGFGNNVTIIKENIPFDGGVIHIVDGYFTLPGPLSQTLKASSLGSAFGAYPNASLDSTPSITVFAPASSALLAALGTNSTLSPSEASALVNAHVILNNVIYSPLLIDGARFKSADGGNVVISEPSPGNILVNGVAKIIQADTVIANGVVHIIDKPLFVPSRPSVSPVVYTGAASHAMAGPGQMGGGIISVWAVLYTVAVMLCSGTIALLV